MSQTTPNKETNTLLNKLETLLPEENIEKEVIEQCADLEHERWARWHAWSRNHWTEENLKRWDKQAETPYSQLSESEKESDRKEVRQYLPIFQSKMSEVKSKFLPAMLEMIKEVFIKGYESGNINQIEWGYLDKKYQDDLLDLLK